MLQTGDVDVSVSAAENTSSQWGFREVSQQTDSYINSKAPYQNATVKNYDNTFSFTLFGDKRPFPVLPGSE